MESHTTIINIGGLVGALHASYFGYRIKRRLVLGLGSVLAIFVALPFGYPETFGPILFFGGLLQVMFILLNTTAWMRVPELYPTRAAFLLLVNVILLLLGCVLEGTAILLIIVPVFIPTAQALGIDLVHFGVIVVLNIMLGLVTPPYGLLLFIMTAISGAPLRHIVRDCLPFLCWMLICLIAITLFPELVLWLPRLAGYGS